MRVSVLTLFAVPALSLVVAAAARGDEKTDNAKGRLDAARRVYETLSSPTSPQTPTGKQAGQNAPDYDQAYTWSLRWMQAQQDVSDKTEDKVAAAQAHLDRMRKMEDFVRQQQRRGAAADADVAALEYYRLAAEGALAAARGK